MPTVPKEAIVSVRHFGNPWAAPGGIGGLILFHSHILTIA
jgi:hypothetical protein